ncbi:hypothetical protein M501DRAFT_998439 [Patellaria atrata CBS 101060]|uniref:G-patch domain-containing protein n=1 Tax=Patellaria atrata CBS 101060 TaxID=1346257 RepID=A0A9P4VU59_9PEZI|nr:hypothetical protein M501DRAFT_998439 [Patellaria atrata CBS 101060]
MTESDEGEYTIPLLDQRHFGAGIKRKRIKFVPSSTQTSATPPSSTRNGEAVASAYLATVFKNPQTTPDQENGLSNPNTRKEPRPTDIPPTCDICKLPLSASAAAVPHEASIAHQLCLQHSHPPSSVDRSRKGLSIMQSYGFDPDSRLGLGAAGRGILHPIKPKEKRDTVGLGVVVSKSSSDASTPVKVVKGDPKSVRKRQEEDRRKMEKLQRAFYGDEKLERYLGRGI